MTTINSPAFPADTMLTDIFTPFTASLPNPLASSNQYDFSSNCCSTIETEIHATATQVTIWSDKEGNPKFSVPVWTYEGSHPGPAFVVRHDQVMEVRWYNDIADPKGTDPMHDGGNHPLEVVKVPSIADPCESSQVFDNREGFVFLGDFVPQNVTGIETKNVAIPIFHDVHRPRARIVTHLHGGRSSQHSDGWPEAMLRPGEYTDAIYGATHPDAQHRNGGMLWFHDHAMHTTGYNVMAGLAGLWIIRGENESSMQLPSGADEIPLVIQDRNLIIDKCPTDQDTGFGRLLHKTELVEGPMEFFGPLTLVNGVIWPQATVRSGVVRLRFLNGCNSRSLKLVFAVNTGDADPAKKWQLLDRANLPAFQIGADQGFLDHPVPLTEETVPESDQEITNGRKNAIYLTLLSAERADVLVDFSQFAGKEIAVFNLAAAPYGGSGPLSLKQRLSPGFEPWTDIDRVPYPHVMAFSVSTQSSEQTESLLDMTARISTKLADLSKSVQPKQSTVDRVIAIVEKQKPKDWKVNLTRIVDKISTPVQDPDPVLVLWELVPVTEIGSTAPSTQNPGAYPALKPLRHVTIKEGAVENSYWVVAERFQDPVSFIVNYGATERWRFINLTADSHPIHLHLVDFRTCQRQFIKTISVNGSELKVDDSLPEKLSATLYNSPFASVIELELPSENGGVREGELGPKDTARIDPGESIVIEAQFKGHTGRYVYHCHLLEHEDHDMMRQFVVARDDHIHMHKPVSSIGIEQKSSR